MKINYGLLHIYLILMIILYIKSFGKVKQMSRENKKLRYNNKYCPNCGTPVKSDYCTGCGAKNE